MKILWIAKTKPMGEQLDELVRLFPGAEVEVDLREVRNTTELVTRIRAGKYDEVVAVVPWSMLSQLTERGIYPLYPKIRRERGTIQHIGIFRCESVDLNLRTLTPLSVPA
jgi:hypothetical protein